MCSFMEVQVCTEDLGINIQVTAKIRRGRASLRKTMENERAMGQPRGRAIFQRWAEEGETLPGPEKLSGKRRTTNALVMEDVVGSL